MKHYLWLSILIMTGGINSLAGEHAALAPVFTPRYGTYHYDIEWRGIEIGTAEIEVGGTDTEETLRMNARSSKAIDTFTRLRYDAETVISKEGLVPQHTVIRSRSGAKEDVTTFDYHADGTLTRTEEKHRQRRATRTKSEHIEAQDMAQDALVAVAAVRRLDWDIGKERDVDLMLDDERYTIRLRCNLETEIEVDGQSRQAWSLVPTIFRYGERKPHRAVDRLRVYVSNDPHRDILQIRGKSKYGYFYVKMRLFTELCSQ